MVRARIGGFSRFFGIKTKLHELSKTIRAVRIRKRWIPTKEKVSSNEIA